MLESRVVSGFHVGPLKSFCIHSIHQVKWGQSIIGLFQSPIWNHYVFPVQVDKYGPSSMEIPQHEVITRRQQFRMKRNRADDKRQKNEEKHAEKNKKLEEKKEKNTKKPKKANTSPKKAGRNAKDKKKDLKESASPTKGHSKKLQRYRKMVACLASTSDSPTNDASKSKTSRTNKSASSKMETKKKD